MTTSYRLVLPQPWARLSVRSGYKERVAEMVDTLAAKAPNNVPPDQVGPWRRQLERQLLGDLRRAREYGTVDIYLPTDTWHGFLLGASFVVSEASPPGVPPEEFDGTDEAVGAVMAELISTHEGSSAVTIGDTVWVRREYVEQPDADELPGLGAATRRVEYLTAIPGRAQVWVLVAFSCIGNGDPDDRLARLTTELFDAIMGTWKWVHDPDSSD